MAFSNGQYVFVTLIKHDKSELLIVLNRLTSELFEGALSTANALMILVISCNMCRT